MDDKVSMIISAVTIILILCGVLSSIESGEPVDYPMPLLVSFMSSKLGLTESEEQADYINLIELEPDYTNSIGMEFMKIPSGEFMMGSPSNEKDREFDEGPVHKVTIEEPYYLGKYEVTQEQWLKVMGSNPSRFEGNDHPVEKVSWNDVQDFIEKLNEMEGSDKYRLPSEAEWEYACRAGTTTRFYFGDDMWKLEDYAWYCELLRSTTYPVGQKKPNLWGLYDMHGNVREWCQDKWHYNYNGAPSDGSAWEDGLTSRRVVRDGGWYYDAWYFRARFSRSASRDDLAPNSRNNDLGFRVLMEIEPDSKDSVEPEPDSKDLVELETGYTNSIGMEFMKIPAGEFMMGSPEDEEVYWDCESPVHKVTIEKPFYLGKYEVTQKQWREVMSSNPSNFHSIFKNDDNLPVENVSWYDVQKFIKKLNEMEGSDKYRLPYEAEWEYACRAGTTTRFDFGDGGWNLNDYAWYLWNSDLCTHPVGQKKPNSWGLYDMHGNVVEWCQDSWHNNYEGAPSDGSAWEDGSSSNRVIRGGGWESSSVFSESGSRSCEYPGNCSNDLGFRVVRDI